MCKIKSISILHKAYADEFQLYLDNKKIILFEYNKNSDMIDDVLNELSIAIEDKLCNIEEVKKDMQTLINSKRVNAFCYE